MRGQIKVNTNVYLFLCPRKNPYQNKLSFTIIYDLVMLIDTSHIYFDIKMTRLQFLWDAGEFSYL